MNREKTQEMRTLKTSETNITHANHAPTTPRGTRRVRATLSALTLLALGAAGCDATTSGDTQPTGDATTGDATAQDASGTSMTPAERAQAYRTYIADRMAAECAHDLRCESPAPYDSQEACVADRMASASQTKLDRIASSIEAGKTSFDPAMAEACVDVYGGKCELSFLNDVAPVCNPVIDGLVPIGEACVGHFECARPADHEGTGPYCFDGCTAAWGDEDPAVHGVCYLQSPLTTPECQ